MAIKLFVGNLSTSVTTDQLVEMFSEYGTVVEGDALGKFGFVHMETQEEAEAAISGLNGSKVEGVAIKVEISQGGNKKEKGGGRGGPQITSTKLFVGNLNDTITSDDLRDLFSQHGTVKEADAKGKYGFVHMASTEEAAVCLRELKGAFIRDVPINIEVSEDKNKKRDDGFSRGGDRGGGRGGRGGGGGPVKLFVGNMNDNITNDDLQKLFSMAGNVSECAAKGRYGFVHMSNWEEAQNAIKLCNRHLLKGQVLNVEMSDGGGRGGFGGRDGGYGGGFDDSYGAPMRGPGGGGRSFGDTTIKIFIGNLTEKTTTEELIGLFNRYGRVKESDSQACGKFGFVHMFYMTDAERAIYELNGTMLHGQRVNVELSQKGDKFSGGGGGGGAGPDRRRPFGGRRDERPYDRPSRMDPAPPRDAMAVADYYQRTGRLPPADLDRDLPPRDTFSSYSMYERERLAYDAYRDVMSRADPYARDPYARADYRSAVDPFARPPPEAYGSKRFDDFDRPAARERDYAAGSAADRFSLTPEAAYAISRFAEADRFRSASAAYDTDAAKSLPKTRGASNGASESFTGSGSAGGAGGYSSASAFSSLYSGYGAR